MVSLLVRLTCGQMYPVPPVEASSGKELYYCGSAWHLVSLCIRQTFDQMYPPTSYAHCPQVEASSGKEGYYYGSAWYMFSLWVRLTFGQMYPCTHTLCSPCPTPHCYPAPQWRHLVALSDTTLVSLTFGQPVGKADLWSDVPFTPMLPEPSLSPHPYHQ